MIALKRLFVLAVGSFVAASSFAQKKDVPKGWHLQDQRDSGYYGISMAKAYDFVKSKNLKSTPVIVAVIDSGIDTLHEDLKPILWLNEKEIAGNGIDDDGNGYIDDVYGWNFLGGRDGRNVEKDSYEAARVYHKLKNKYGGNTVWKDSSGSTNQKEFKMWAKAKKDVVDAVQPEEPADINQMKQAFENLHLADSMINLGDALIRKDLGKEEYTCKDLAAYNPINIIARRVKSIMQSVCKDNNEDGITNTDLIEDIQGQMGQLEGEIAKIESVNKAPEDFRNEIVKDNYSDINNRFYGNNNVMVSKSSALHGTHVAGIIGAARNNGKGMDGVADNVKVMMIRAVPDGDEHDKDIALAIRYAVDNGARVINMSFGKGFSPEKKWVDDAVKYASSKGVLLVHAAGNSAQNVDTSWNFPTAVYEDGKRAGNWITVGASGPGEDGKGTGLTASFSNYGKKEVDVFAPGVKIYSTVPGGNTYQNLQGTSMAAPVVAGLAAFIIEYFPTLSPEQVKTVIEKSSQKPAVKVKEPGTGATVNLSDISKSGGVINAYEAIKLAANMKGDAKPAKSKVTSSDKQ